MEDTDFDTSGQLVPRSPAIAMTHITTVVCSSVTVDIVDDGRVRIYSGQTTLFLQGWDAELLSRELLSAAVRAQHQLERAL